MAMVAGKADAFFEKRHGRLANRWLGNDFAEG
jgi:hypothetical protein